MRIFVVVVKLIAAASMASEHKGYRKPGGGKPLFNLPEITVDLQLTDQSSLCDNRGRQACPKCGKSRSLFCFDCLVPFTNTPHVKLPFNVSVITHHAEALSKTTGVHAALLAPDRVQLHDISRPPDFDPARSIVLYPAAGAVTVDRLEAGSIDRVFLIDSNWKKSKEIFLNPVLANVRCVKLTEKQTAFWRWHGRGVARDGTSLCTIESLYFLLKALLDAGKLPEEEFQSSSCFDDLLWYFTFQHRLIKEYSEERRPQGRKGKRKRGRDDGQRQLNYRACEPEHEAER